MEKDLQHGPFIIFSHLSFFCKVWLGYLELFGFLAIINMQAGASGRTSCDLVGLLPNLGPGGQDGSKTRRLWSAWLLSRRC